MHSTCAHSHNLHRCVLAVVLFAMTAITGYAQTHEIDSLRNVVLSQRPQGSIRDSTLVKQCANVAAAAMNAQALDTALVYTDKALSLLSSWQGGAANDAFTLRAFAKAYRRKALIHHQRNDNDNSLKNALLLRDVAERSGDRKLLGTAFQIMANSYRGSNDEARAIEASHQAIAILSTLPPNIELADAHHVLAGLYMDTRVDSAILHFNKALPIYEAFQSATDFIAIHLNLEELFLNRGLLDSAASHYSAASLAEQMEHGFLLGRYYGHGAKLRLLQGKAEEALDLVNKAQALAENQPADLSEYHHIRSLALARLGRVEDAYAELRKGNDQMVADQGADQARDMAKVDAEHLRSKDQLIAAAKLAAERKQKRYAMIGAAGLLALVTLLLLLFRASKRKAKILAEKNAEILRAQENLVVSEKQREVEQVRTRIARDIHDDVGGELTRISMLSGEVRKQILYDTTLANEGLEQMRTLARQVSATLSDVVWAVDPQQDTAHSLVRHAESYAHRMLDGARMKTDLRFTADGVDRALDPLMKNNIFLVLKEAVHNALKYAQADRLHVELVTDETGYQLLVKDNGQGYDPAAMAREGNGLRNMQARATQLGAELRIVAAPNAGAEVRMAGAWGPMS